MRRIVHLLIERVEDCVMVIYVHTNWVLFIESLVIFLLLIVKHIALNHQIFVVFIT